MPSDESDPLTRKYLSAFNLMSCDEARQTASTIHKALSVAWNKGHIINFHPVDVDLIWHQHGLTITRQLDLTISEPGADEIVRRVLRRLNFEVSPPNGVLAEDPKRKRPPTAVALPTSPSLITTSRKSDNSGLRWLRKKLKIVSLSPPTEPIPSIVAEGQCYA